MALEQLTRSRGGASISVVQSTIQSMETPPKVNPFTQSSSSVEAIDALTSMTGKLHRTYLITTAPCLYY